MTFHFNATTETPRAHGNEIFLMPIVLLVIFNIAVLALITPTKTYAETCQEANLNYQEKHKKELDVQYSGLNINAVRAVYYIGRPTYLILDKFNDYAGDAVIGFGQGGPAGVLAQVIVKGGVDAGIAKLNKFLGTPQQLALEIGANDMARGMQALEDNQRLYKKGLNNLSANEHIEFSRNEKYAELMGYAKKLYLAAKNDRNTYSTMDAELEVGSSITEVLADSSILSNVVKVAKVHEVLRRSKLPIDTYKPLVNYRATVDSFDKKWACINNTQHAPEKVTSPPPGLSDLPKFSDCQGGNISGCRKYCYNTCDHNKDNRVGGNEGESKCYSVCNRQCDSQCIKTSSAPAPTSTSSDNTPPPKTITSHEGASIWMSIIMLRDGSHGSINSAGITILGPDGNKLSCLQPGSTETPFGRCMRQNFSDDGFEENFDLRKLKRGKYRVSAQLHNSAPTLSIKEGEMKVPSKTDKNRGSIYRLSAQTVRPGSTTAVVDIVIE